jgi:hypothetical protein
MSETSFEQVITEHLTLSERNKRLELTMPLDSYRERGGGSIPSTQVSTAPRDEPASWWETKDGECPPPPIDWDEDD